MFGLTGAELFWASVMGACVAIPCGYIVLNKLDFMTGEHNETWNPLKWFQIPGWMKPEKDFVGIKEYERLTQKYITSLEKLKKTAVHSKQLEAPSKIPFYKPAQLVITEYQIPPKTGYEESLEEQIAQAAKEAEEKRLLEEKQDRKNEQREKTLLKHKESKLFFEGSEPFGDVVEQEWLIDGSKAFIDSKNRVFIHDRQWINKTSYFAREELGIKNEHISFESGIQAASKSFTILPVDEYKELINLFCFDQKIHIYNLENIEKFKIKKKQREMEEEMYENRMKFHKRVLENMALHLNIKEDNLFC